MPLISICIPFFKNLNYLQRLLDSISIQTFHDFEVVVTDDGNDLSIANLLSIYETKFTINYFKNPVALGTPANWNFAISKATGSWIKMMHSDDWFRTNDALQIFYENISKHNDSDFFFSAYENVQEGSGEKQIVKMSFLDKFIFGMNPYHLLKKVYVGNPSCTLVRKNLNIRYDTRFKFIVDFEYYIRIIQQTKTLVYIDKVLLNIGFHKEQVTTYTKYNPEVQIPENMIFLNEQKKDILKNVIVFDYFWRLIRNLKIDSAEKLSSFLGNNEPKQSILFMINFQKKIPFFLLKTGVVSKFFMFIAFCINLFKN
jgi:glycosyltransferase involved in cell wall biosynthesis